MKRGTKFLAGLAAAVITFASLTAFVGPRYHLGWQYDNHYGGRYPYRNYWQQPPYPPTTDSAYNRPYSPDSHQ